MVPPILLSCGISLDCIYSAAICGQPEKALALQRFSHVGSVFCCFLPKHSPAIQQYYHACRFVCIVNMAEPHVCFVTCKPSVHSPSLTPLLECQKPVGSHLRLIKQAHSSELVTEWQLISVRGGRFLPTEESCSGLYVCDTHRNCLGIQCRPKNTCQHPAHTGSKTKAVDRTMNSSMTQEILQAWDVLLPVGSGEHVIELLYP